jgi:ParB-like chromosome segregation protein Spo0J
MEITQERTGDLIPRHDVDRPEDLEAIAASMAEHGWQGAPVVIDDRMVDGGYLITGNHRHAAAIKAGLETVPCVTLADLCADAGIDPDDYCDGSYDSDWAPLLAELPADVQNRYGIQF